MNNKPSKEQHAQREGSTMAVIPYPSKTQTPKESAYWQVLKTGLITLFGKRVKITNLLPNQSGARNG